MPKATHSTAAETTKKKPAATRAKATARKPAAKKPAAKKPVPKTVAKKCAAKKLVKKSAAKKLAPKKSAATRTKAPGKPKKPDATVKSRAVKSPAKSTTKSATRAAKVAAARRVKSAVLEVSPSVIDTTSAAEVAARLVVDAHGPVPVAPSPLGNLSKALSNNLFDPPPVVAVKRGSSALRHVKEQLNKPVARQLESVFGPAPVHAETMRRFLKGQKTARGQRVHANTSTHFGPSKVPHRPVGGGGSRSGE